MNFDEVIKNRYSVRRFSEEKVSDKLINKILETGRIAPSAGNKQPTVIYLLNEEQIGKLEKATEAKIHPVVFRSNNALLVCYDKNIEMKRPHDGFTFGMTDASIVTTYMMLKITELGLGSTWIGWFDPKLIKEVLEIPDNFEVVSILSFGYILDGTKPSRLHKERKSMNEFRIYKNYL